MMPVWRTRLLEMWKRGFSKEQVNYVLDLVDAMRGFHTQSLSEKVRAWAEEIEWDAERYDGPCQP